MTQYRLLEPYVIDGAEVPKGTHIGDGTPILFRDGGGKLKPPGRAMETVSDEDEKKYLADRKAEAVAIAKVEAERVAAEKAAGNPREPVVPRPVFSDDKGSAGPTPASLPTNTPRPNTEFDLTKHLQSTGPRKET